MKAYIFDSETNGLLLDATKCHSLVLLDVGTGEMTSCADQPGYTPIQRGLEMLAEADLIIGHNIICYDIPALRKLYPWWQPKGSAFQPRTIRDTLVISRLIWPEIKEQVDWKLVRKKKVEAGKWMGRHSLESWGIRLGEYKGDFGKKTDWKFWTKEMQDYCEQDVRVTAKLWGVIEGKQYSEMAIELEHKFRFIIFEQEQFGFCFDEQSAHKLCAELTKKRLELEDQLRAVFPPWYKSLKEFTPKGDNRKMGYRKGCPMTKVELVEFNPGSSDHIADRLQRLRGWKPEEFTDSGKPAVTEDVFKKMPWPEAKLLAEYMVVKKMLGQLAEGDKAWLKYVRGGRIHGSVVTNGAVTGRCTHKEPNIAQVPKVGSPYGKESRSLFGPPKGMVQVGCDASGLELRMFGHYTARYDGGSYAQIVVAGDPHWANAQALEVVPQGVAYDEKDPVHKKGRGDIAKRFIYAYLYGAGPVKLGSVTKPLASEAEQKREGKRLMANFLKRMPAVKMLKEAILAAIKKNGHLKGLDGRHLYIRSDHSALNTLLQSAGALAVKLATVLFYEEMIGRGYRWGIDFALMAHIHDELQIACRPEIADEVGKLCAECITKAGEVFDLRVRLDGEYKIGRNWAETH